ncbi:MAG: UvrD-helicase domain-containing protein, partial [Desulfobulbaceae bacterium]|nr:UvrD-helicase domain-containing protein [Desulfobulbaceae bacterium]
MPYLADLHIHSPFSRATSKESNLPGLASWARVKGIQVVGTGDFTHPGWLAQLKEQLTEAEPGFFRLRDDNLPPALPGVTPEAIPTRFVLTAEVSSIYKRHSKVRKIHNLLYAPDFASVERINGVLAGIGNIESDGRPILGLDSRDLLEIVLEQAPEGFLVPAHIWTPWFSLFGSKSGFDTVEECFGDLAGHVFALETGLSSDPAMNRLISALDRFTLISNSDCHSPGKLGREVNLFDTAFDFFAMREALKNPATGFAGTVEFFPEEGKYHCDGHRKCGISLEPAETRRMDCRCPVCGRPLTVGVLHRVMELADRDTPSYPAGAPGFESLIPLTEILGEILGQGVATKGVVAQYGRLINLFGSEFALLRTTPVDEIGQKFSPLLAEAVQRMRQGKVIRNPGYDGEFGVIRVFADNELDDLAGQTNLFGTTCKRKAQKKETARLPLPQASQAPAGAGHQPRACNPEQEAAVASQARNILVAAGPGTGKTFTLVSRIVRLLADQGAEPRRCVAITFTNRAADEVRQRLRAELGERADDLFVGTFHRFCLHWLRRDQPELVAVGDEERELLLKRLFPELGAGERRELAAELAAAPAQGGDVPVAEPVARYRAELARLPGLDLDGVIPAMVGRLTNDPEFRGRVTAAVDHLFVDEFQDLNPGQYRLVQLLADQAQLFAIGDPDQAIYGFRGADPACFFDFAHRPDTQRLALTRNYRSAPAILAAAASVIRHNRQRSGVELIPHNDEPVTITCRLAPTAQAEAEGIVQGIEKLMGGVSHFSLNTGRGGSGTSQLSFADIAVLYRLSQQADPIAEALSRRGIPFQLVGATPFFMRRELRPAFYLVRAALAGTVAEHLELLRGIKGVGDATMDRLERELPLNGDFFANLSGVALPEAARKAILPVRHLRDRFADQCRADGIAAALGTALPELAIDPAGGDAHRLLTLAGTFGHDLEAFGRHLAENRRATVYDERAEAVALMTLHGAKGLEFPAVFLTGLEEDILPCRLP